MATPVAQIPIRMKGQTTCIEHKDKQLDLYCKDCSTLVCLTCLLSKHRGHDVCELKHITHRKKEDIQNFIDKIEQNELPQLSKYITSTDTLFKENIRNFDNLSEKLEAQTEQLKSELDLLAAKTLSMYHKMKEDNIKIIQKYKEDLEAYEKNRRKHIQDCKATLQNGSDIDIYDTGCEPNFQVRFPVKPDLESASFTPNQNPQHHLEVALGTKYNLLPTTNVLDEWKSPVSINSICPTTDGKVWTRDYYSTVLTQQDKKGNVMQEVKHNADISDIRLSPSSHTLWVCDKENKILEMVSGRLIHRFSTKKKPTCICATVNDHVIVGIANNISKFTPQGLMVLTTNTARTGKPLVCSPYRITECPITLNVAVIDKNEKSNGGDDKHHVIVMDKDFKKLFVYRGDIPNTYQQATHKEAKPIHLRGVVYDSVGNIIIGDRDNSRIILLSGCGEFLRIIHTDKNGTSAVGLGKGNILCAVFRWRNVKLLEYSNV